MDEPEVTSLAHLARTPAERAAAAVPWGAAAVWGAAEILHWAAWPGMTAEASMAAVAAFGIAFGASAHKGWGWKVPALTAAFAAWIIFASARGPLSGFPVPPLTIMWAVLTGITWRLASRHPSILEAVRWRAARAEWLAVRHAWHLPGSHLIAHEETRLGEQFVIDVSDSPNLASAIARDSALPERIAMRRVNPIPRSRVTVTEGTPAGRVIIKINDRDPWAEPIPHPAVTPGHEIELDPSPSITSPQPVGQDPATGRTLPVLLCSPTGGRNVNIVATLEGGKTTLLSCISERVAACPDALMIRINLSEKGEAEPYLWGPACYLTAFGPDEKDRALKVLKAVRGIMRWRSQQPKTRANWLPSPGDPHIVLIIDEIDALTEVPLLRKTAEPVFTKGREYGLTTVRAGQRGTAEWTGGANIRAVDGVYFLGNLNRSTEAMHVAGDLGLRLPDVAAYGEGHEGVWVEADKKWGGRWQGGRGWNLSEPADIAGIAEARAHSQPDLPPECREFLGEDLAILLGTDVYARWARRSSPAPGTGPGLSRPHMTPLNPVGDATAATAVNVDDPIERLDYPMDENMKEQFAAVDAKLSAAKRDLAETQAMDKGPAVSQEKLREASEAGWAQLAEETVIPPQVRERMLDLLSGDGLSGRKVTDALTAENPGSPPKRAWVMAWLNRLRWEKVAYLNGKGAGARWRLTAERGDGS